MAFIFICLALLTITGLVLIVPELTKPRLYVLIYHHIAADDEKDNNDLLYTVNEGDFAEQMRLLSEGKLDVWGLEEVSKYFNGSLKLNRSTAVVTIDDGYHSILTKGLPYLKKYKIPAILFASPYPDWKEDEFSDRMLTPKELLKLSKEGVAVQSHTLNHHPLSELRDSEVYAEFKRSKQYLESITGKEIISLAPPGNFYRRKFDILLQKAGYSLCFSADKGSNGLFDKDPMRIRRLIVEKLTGKKGFLKLMSPLGSAKARVLGTLKKLPMGFLTPNKWLGIRKKIFNFPGMKQVLTSKGLTIVGGLLGLLFLLGVIFGVLS